jgi:hypothetical protein
MTMLSVYCADATGASFQLSDQMKLRTAFL